MSDFITLTSASSNREFIIRKILVMHIQEINDDKSVVYYQQSVNSKKVSAQYVAESSKEIYKLLNNGSDSTKLS